MLYRFIPLSIKDHYRFYHFIAFFTCIQSKIIIAFIAFLLYCIINQRSLSLLLLYRFFHLYTIKDHYRFYCFIALSHYWSKIIITFIALSLFSLVYNQRSLSLLSLYRFITLSIKDHYRFYRFIAFFTCI